MKTNRIRVLLAATAMFATAGTLPAQDSEPGQDSDQAASQRMEYRDERPDFSRGWVIVAKSSYWPLCYESLERLEQARNLIGQNKPDELASALEKSGAWLELASSAAMVDNRSGVPSTADRVYEAADAVRSGSGGWSDKKLHDLIVLANLSMAKSHALRARAADESGRAERNPNRSVAASEAVRQATAEIEAEKKARALAQYRFDTREALRHLRVATVYYQAAREASSSDEIEALKLELPELPAEAKGAQLTDYVDEYIRPGVEKMLTAIDAQRKKLIARIEE